MSEAWFRSVVEAANEGIWIIDHDAKTIFANERMAAMLATTPEAMIGTRPFDYLYEQDFDNARAVMEANYRGEPMEFEIRFRRCDGSDIPVLAGSAPLRDDRGEITGSVATFSDLTERKKAEQALLDSEREAKATAALLKQLMQAAADAIWMRDPEGIFRVANPAAMSIMGGSEADIIGRDIYEIWGPEVGARLAAETEAIFKSAKGITVEEEMMDASREAPAIFLSNKVPIYSTDGEPIGILGISRDITQRKRNENELRESRSRLSQQVAELNALYQSAPIGLAFFSRDYRYLRINDELAAINGVPAEDHIGKTIREVLSDTAPPVEPLIDRVFATGRAIGNVEASGETPHEPGVMRHWLTGFYPVKDASGAVEAVGAWVVEISERKAAEQREQLLAREVDHRAKNLLAVVQSVVQLTRAGTTEELKDAVIGRIQSLARAHALLADSRWEGVELSQLVADEMAPFGSANLPRVTFSGPPIRLRPGSAQSIALVLHELATNAAKYGALSIPEGGLDIRWEVIGNPAQIAIAWTESGCSGVAEPRTVGFGSRIIRTSVERQLQGTVAQEWRTDGLQCKLQFALDPARAKPDE